LPKLSRERNNLARVEFQQFSALILAPQPKRAACPAPALSARGFFCVAGRIGSERQGEGSRNIDGLQPSCMARGLVIRQGIMARLLTAARAMVIRISRGRGMSGAEGGSGRSCASAIARDGVERIGCGKTEIVL
jgi:hypothetical protein